jgi:hypothetical protein
MSSETQTQNQDLINFMRKYTARAKEGKERVIEVTYMLKWDLKKLVEEAQNVAISSNKVVRILGVYSLDFGKNISITVLPSGSIRFTIMLGFRVGVNYPNAIDVTPTQINELEILLGKAKELAEKLQS